MASKEETKQNSDYSEDYPWGDMAERYDAWKEKKMGDVEMVECFGCGKGITVSEAHAVPFQDGRDDFIYRPYCNECFIKINE